MTATAAEKAVRAAGAALAQAEQQLEALDEEIQAKEAEAAQVEAEITAAHESGAQVKSAQRARRRECLAVCEDLARERATLEELVQRRTAELQSARVDLARERAAEYEADAEARGEEFWELLGSLVEAWDQLEAINAAHRREAGTVQRAGFGGRGTALQRAGLENRKHAIEALVVAIREDLAKRSAA